MARGQVVHRKHDADENSIVRSNQNLILGTYLYQVDLSEGEITEFAYVIAESINAQCHVDENEYHLLEAFNNHRKNGSALRVQD